MKSESGTAEVPIWENVDEKLFVRFFEIKIKKNTVDRNGTSVCVKKLKSEVKFRNNSWRVLSE